MWVYIEVDWFLSKEEIAPEFERPLRHRIVTGYWNGTCWLVPTPFREKYDECKRGEVA